MTIKEYIDKVFQDKICWAEVPHFRIKLNGLAEVASNNDEAVTEISCSINEPKDFYPQAKQQEFQNGPC